MKTEFQSCRSNMRYMTEEKQGCPTEAEGKTFSPCKGNMQRAWSVTMMTMTMMTTIFVGVKCLGYCWKKL